MPRVTNTMIMKRLVAIERRLKKLEPPAVLSAAIGFEISGGGDDESLPYDEDRGQR